MAILLRVGNPDVPVVPYRPADQEKGFTLEELRAAIGGGWFELVKLEPVPDTDEHWFYLVVDEEGKSKGLPENLLATIMYQQARPASDEVIVGPALFVEVAREIPGRQERIW